MKTQTEYDELIAKLLAHPSNRPGMRALPYLNDIIEFQRSGTSLRQIARDAHIAASTLTRVIKVNGGNYA